MPPPGLRASPAEHRTDTHTRNDSSVTYRTPKRIAGPYNVPHLPFAKPSWAPANIASYVPMAKKTSMHMPPPPPVRLEDLPPWMEPFREGCAESDYDMRGVFARRVLRAYSAWSQVRVSELTRAFSDFAAGGSLMFPGDVAAFARAVYVLFPDDDAARCFLDYIEYYMVLEFQAWWHAVSPRRHMMSPRYVG